METILDRVDRDIHFSINGLEFIIQLSSTCSCEKWTIECITSNASQEKVAKIMNFLFSSLFSSQNPVLANASYKLYHKEYSILFPARDNLVKEIWERWDTKRLGSKAEQWDGQLSTLKNKENISWLLKEIQEVFQADSPISFTRSNKNPIL